MATFLKDMNWHFQLSFFWNLWTKLFLFLRFYFLTSEPDARAKEKVLVSFHLTRKRVVTDKCSHMGLKKYTATRAWRCYVSWNKTNSHLGLKELCQLEQNCSHWKAWRKDKFSLLFCRAETEKRWSSIQQQPVAAKSPMAGFKPLGYKKPASPKHLRLRMSLLTASFLLLIPLIPLVPALEPHNAPGCVLASRTSFRVSPATDASPHFATMASAGWPLFGSGLNSPCCRSLAGMSAFSVCSSWSAATQTWLALRKLPRMALSGHLDSKAWQAPLAPRASPGWPYHKKLLVDAVVLQLVWLLASSPVAQLPFLLC